MKNIQLLCFLLFFAINFSHSQETTGKLEGKVTSINGELLPYASIVIIDSETNFKYGTSTQESGYYIFTDLPPGDYYEVTVSYVGFKKTVLSTELFFLILLCTYISLLSIVIESI